jgi:exopolyphosphatase/guanosine-5'-triphosphate,3'-diphosphate pyrophosphatase
VSHRRERLAAIDVGSNTILLLIAEYDPAVGLHIIDQAEDQPRLGAGLSQTGHLGWDAMHRALQAVERMRDRCRQQQVARIDAVATAAVREAANGSEFVDQVHRLGIPLRTISPHTEALLAYRSAAHHFPGAARMLVADIGGGSLELIGSQQGRIELTTSLPLGAVRMTEASLPLPELRSRARETLSQELSQGLWAGSRVVGSGGTFANLASMTLARRGAPPDQPIQGTEVGAANIEQLLTDLSAMSPDERRQVPGLRPERADIIVAGVAVIAELLAYVGAASVGVNAYGLREGVLLEMIGLE